MGKLGGHQVFDTTFRMSHWGHHLPLFVVLAALCNSIFRLRLLRSQRRK